MSRGAATGLLGAALGVCGLLFALPSLLVPGVALVLVAVVGAAWVRLAARSARVRLSVHPSRLEEGQAAMVAVTAHVRPWSPPAELSIPSLGGGESAGRGQLALRAEARFGRRGPHLLGPARLSVADPLGVAERTSDERSSEVLVLPRVEPVRAVRRAGLDGFEGAAGRGAGPELEFDSLRPHRPGSPASRIHWPTVARTGDLVERHLNPESDCRPMVVLDSTAPASEESLDRAVRAAASICRALAAAGGCRLLLPGEHRAAALEPDLWAWPAAHARLALVEAGEAPPRLPRSLAASALFWVLAARRPAPRALLRSGARSRYLVTPGRPPAAGAVFTVAGCAGVRVERARTRARAA